MSGAASVVVTSADVALTALQATKGTIFVSGALTGGPRRLLIDHTVTTLALGDRYIVVNTCTNAQTLTFALDNAGVGLWIPPTTGGVTVEWNGSDFIYVDSGGGYVLAASQTVAVGPTAPSTFTDLWMVPLGWSLAGAVARSTQTGAGVGVSTSMGTSHGGGELIARHTPGAAGTAVFHTGSGLAAGAEIIANNTTVSLEQANSGAVTTPYIENFTLRVVKI